MEIETEFLAAKEDLAIVNNRIRELEYILRNSEWVLPGKVTADVSETRTGAFSDLYSRLRTHFPQQG